MSTYNIDYNKISTDESLLILKGMADFTDILVAEEFVKEKSWEGIKCSIVEIAGLFVIYDKNDAEKINKIYNYDIIERPESIKRFDLAKKACKIVENLHLNKTIKISDDAKDIMVYYKNGKLLKKYRVDKLMYN